VSLRFPVDLKRLPRAAVGPSAASVGRSGFVEGLPWFAEGLPWRVKGRVGGLREPFTPSAPSPAAVFCQERRKLCVPPEKKRRKVWSLRRDCVPLHPLSPHGGGVGAEESSLRECETEEAVQASAWRAFGRVRRAWNDRSIQIRIRTGRRVAA